MDPMPKPVRRPARAAASIEVSPELNLRRVACIEVERRAVGVRRRGRRGRRGLWHVVSTALLSTIRRLRASRSLSLRIARVSRRCCSSCRREKEELQADEQ